MTPFEDITYEVDGPAGIITISRPERYNAFRARTVEEMIKEFRLAWTDHQVRAVILTGAGDRAFCSGGDQQVRGASGYVDPATGAHRLNGLDLQRQIRTCPKPVIAMAAGYAVAGGSFASNALICRSTSASSCPKSSR